MFFSNLASSTYSQYFLSYERVSSVLEALYGRFDKVWDDKTILFTGDSLTDNGGLDHLTDGFLPGPGYFEGVFSLGPIWSQQLAEDLHIEDVSLYSATPGELTTTRALNTALGTSTTGSQSLALDEIGGTLWQLDQLELTVQAGLTNFEEDAVATLWSGHNDFVIWAQSGFPVSLGDAVSASVDNTVEAVDRLITEFGVDDIIVIKMAPLDQTPFWRNAGLSEVAELFVDTFNDQVEDELLQYQQTTGIDPDIIEFYDPNQLFDSLINNPGFYGLTNVTDPASNLQPGFQGEPEIVDNPEDFLFADGVHPTPQVYDILADQIRLEFGYEEAIEDFPFLERFLPSPTDALVAAAERSDSLVGLAA